MMFGSSGISPKQLVDMMLDPQKQVKHRKPWHFAGSSNDGCGCCPICREFIYAEFTQDGGLASCPSCGGLIDALDPLGSPGG